MPRRYTLEEERLFARLYELNKAVEILCDHKHGAYFETIIKVTAEFGMSVEAALPVPSQRRNARLSYDFARCLSHKGWIGSCLSKSPHN